MPALPYSAPDPPPGVPGWLWPPKGATVDRVVLAERVESDGRASYVLLDGRRPRDLHLGALIWLLDEHDRDDPPTGLLAPVERTVVLEIATTEMPSGRTGHAYALNGAPLGMPGASAPRGTLWRWVHDALGRQAGGPLLGGR